MHAIPRSDTMRCQLFAAVVGLASVLAAVAVGCDSNAPPAMTPASTAGFPAYAGPVIEVFDDQIDPAAVGLSMEGVSPRSDRFLRQRAQTADVVARVRINTVTADSIGDDVTYHLDVEVAFPTLAPTKDEERSFELSIRPANRAFPIAKAFDQRLRGMTFVGFMRRFMGPDGEPEVHWHLSPDNAEVAGAVKEAVTLRELSGS
jgi:hypothetical protein